MRSAALAVCAALLTFPSAVLGQADPDAQVGVKEATMAWQAAWNAGNGAGIAALYAEDAVILPPGGDAVKGSEAIAAFWQAAIDASPGTTVELKQTELHNLGDVAVEVGSFVDTAADGSHADHGKYLVLWKRIDGEWKLVRDIWNSSMPE
jgi:uncharacterized protein (TIGR02246 family)